MPARPLPSPAAPLAGLVLWMSLLGCSPAAEPASASLSGDATSPRAAPMRAQAPSLGGNRASDKPQDRALGLVSAEALGFALSEGQRRPWVAEIETNEKIWKMQREAAPGGGGRVVAANGLAVEAALYEFGRIEEAAGVQTTRFVLTNSGSQVVWLSGAEVTCPCVTATVNPDGFGGEPGRQELAPGASTELEVRYDPAGRKGVDAKDVTIVTTPLMNEPLKVRTIIEVLPRWESFPSYVNFPPSPLGERSTVMPVVLVSREEGAQVREARLRAGDAGAFRWAKLGSWEDAIDGRPVRCFGYAARYEGHATPAEAATALSFTVSSGLKRPLEVPLRGRAVGPVAPSPARLFMGIRPEGSTVTRRVFLGARDRGDGHRLTVFGGTPNAAAKALGVTVEPADPKQPTGRSWKVSVTAPRVTGNRAPGQTQEFPGGAITFHTDHPEQPKVVVPVSLTSLVPRRR